MRFCDLPQSDAERDDLIIEKRFKIVVVSYDSKLFQIALHNPDRDHQSGRSQLKI